MFIVAKPSHADGRELYPCQESTAISPLETCGFQGSLAVTPYRDAGPQNFLVACRELLVWFGELEVLVVTSNLLPVSQNGPTAQCS
jgi:hypothetical protein